MEQPDTIISIIKQYIDSEIEPLTISAKTDINLIDTSRFEGEIEQEFDQQVTLHLDVLSAIVPEDSTDELLKSLQPLLKSHGWLALRATSSENDFSHLLKVSSHHGIYRGAAMLVFFPANDPVTLLYARQTNGVNYDIMTNDVINKLDAWRESSDFDILGAGTDWIDIQFTQLPKDVLAFAEDIYDFCPDTLDQGVVKEAPSDLQDIEEPSEEDIENMMDWLENTMDDQTTEDLANYLKRTQRLYLWWD